MRGAAQLPNYGRVDRVKLDAWDLCKPCEHLVIHGERGRPHCDAKRDPHVEWTEERTCEGWTGEKGGNANGTEV